MNKRIENDAQARFIGYAESRQAGNCHEGSRDWSRGAVYMLALEEERAGQTLRADALFDLQERMSDIWHYEEHAFDHPLASISVAELNRLMSAYTSPYTDQYRAMFPCSHSASCATCKDSPQYPCAHYCGDPCRGIDDATRMALDALASYHGEWSRALKYIARGAFIRSLRISEAHEEIARRFTLSSRNHPQVEAARLRSYDFGMSYFDEGRRAPRVDVSSAFHGSATLEAVTFMRRFADERSWSSYRAVYLYGATLPATVSARDFKRNHQDMFAFMTSASAVSDYAVIDADAVRDAYATWLAPQVVDCFRDRLHLYIRDYDATLHEQVSRRDLMRLLAQLQYDASARNAVAIYEALVSLASASATQARPVASLYTVPFSAFVAEELRARLASYDVDVLRADNLDRLRAALPWSYICDRVVSAWRRAIVERYEEMKRMREAVA